MQKLIMSNPKTAMWFLSRMPASFWEKKGRAMTLATFYQTVQRVPAYKDFLQKKGIDPLDIQTLEDFYKKVPIISKKNYFSQYHLRELCQEEIKKDTFGICFTSGTSGYPATMLISKKGLSNIIRGVMNYFDYLWDIYLPSNYTLLINGFALGPWMASFLSNFAISKEAERKNLTLSTPGSNPEMMIEILKKVGKDYNQIIIMVYSSVLKAFLDEAEKRKIDLSEFNIKIVSAGESFPINLREYVLSKIDPSKKDPWRILDLYASTDASVLGFGTPLVIVIQEIFRKNKKLCFDVFGQEFVPSLFQYNPIAVFLEEVNGELIVTKSGIVPIIRYQIGDLGRVFSFFEMSSILKKAGYEIKKLLEERGWQKQYFKWPFVAYWGRSDDMVKLYSGAAVFPHDLFDLLGQIETNEIRNFKLTTEQDKDMNVKLVVYLELKPNFEPQPEQLTQLTTKYRELIHQQLFKNNLSYQDAYRLNPEMTLPIIKIFPFGKGPFEEDKKKVKTRMII